MPSREERRQRTRWKLASANWNLNWMLKTDAKLTPLRTCADLNAASTSSPLLLMKTARTMNVCNHWLMDSKERSRLTRSKSRKPKKSLLLTSPNSARLPLSVTPPVEEPMLLNKLLPRAVPVDVAAQLDPNKQSKQSIH